MIPKTIENTRESDEKTVCRPDDEQLFDADEFNPVLRREITPKILITTCRFSFNSTRRHAFISELLSVIPNSHYQKRGTYDLKKIVDYATKKDFTSLIVVHTNRSELDALLIIGLPNGPTAHFKLSNLVLRKDIKNHGNPTSHKPELVLSGHMFCASSSGGREVPYLPDELLLNCFARISRSYYPSLSLVSKRFRSLLASKELYKTRALLGTSESCLYLILESESSSCGSWFTLCRRPTRPILSCLSSCFCPWKNLMVSVPTHKLYPPPTRWPSTWAPNAVGSDIYMIGGYINGEPSSRVFVMDCLSHTWHEAPSMRVARKVPLVTVIDETIYVMEGSPDGHSQHVIEFFDPKTQIWENLPIPGAEIRISESSAINGNLYLFGDKNVVYKPKENKWDAVGPEVHLAAGGLSACVVDNISYWYSGRQLEWWDSKGSSWRALKGCEHLRNLVKGYHFVRLVNYGGKIAVFWETNVFAKEKKKIWCAEVTLEKRNNGQEIRGKVSRRDVVLTVPKSSFFPKFSSFEHFIVSTV